MSRERAEARAEAQAAQAAPRPARPVGPVFRTPTAPMPRDVKALLGGVALVAVVGLGWLVFGPRPAPIVPVLGYIDAGPPPAPRPTPMPTPAFKMPWWM